MPFAADRAPRAFDLYLLWLCLPVAAMLVGCSKEPEIRTYTVPREAAATPPPAAEATSPAEARLEFEAPVGWSEQPPRPMVSRVFSAGEGDSAVQIELSQFPATAPMIADPLPNVNRWRGQVGLAPIEENELAAVTEGVEIGGAAGLLAEAVADDGSQAVLAAWITKSDRVWFFKMIGSQAGIDAQRNDFVEWLGTVAITAPTDGEPDGDQ